MTSSPSLFPFRRSTLTSTRLVSTDSRVRAMSMGTLEHGQGLDTGQDTMSGTGRDAPEGTLARNETVKLARTVGEGRFFVKRKIRSGAFGDVYLGVSMKEKFYVAVKREKKSTEDPQLIREYKVYAKLKGLPGFPNVYWFGVESNYTYLIMDYLGPSLDDLFKFCNSKFSLKTVLMLAVQLITRIEALHSQDLCHCDIKPDNFLISCSDPKLIYLIDFGLVLRYRNSVTKEHMSCGNSREMVGTARYASLNAHHGLDLSRRDDLESIAYLLIYFLKGSLPWQSDPKANPLELAEIFSIKENTPVHILCDKLPSVFSRFLGMVKALGYAEKPHYNLYIAMFKEALDEHGATLDNEFDWILNNALQTLVPEMQSGSNLSGSTSKVRCRATIALDGTSNSNVVDDPLISKRSAPNGVFERKLVTATADKGEDTKLSAPHSSTLSDFVDEAGELNLRADFRKIAYFANDLKDSNDEPPWSESQPRSGFARDDKSSVSSIVLKSATPKSFVPVAPPPTSTARSGKLRASSFLLLQPLSAPIEELGSSFSKSDPSETISFVDKPLLGNLNSNSVAFSLANVSSPIGDDPFGLTNPIPRVKDTAFLVCTPSILDEKSKKAVFDFSF